MAKTQNKRGHQKTFVLILLVPLLLVANANQQRDYQQSVDKIAKQISNISRNLNANKKQLATAQDKLNQVEQEASNLRKQINKTDAQIGDEKQKGDELDKKLVELANIQKEDKNALKKLVLWRYQKGKTQYLKMLLNQQNPYAVGRLNNYHHYFTQAQEQKLVSIRDQLSIAQQLQEQKDQTLRGLEEQNKTRAAQNQKLQLSRQKRQSIVAKLDKKVGASEQKLIQLRQDRTRLNRLLQQIAKQAEQLKALELQRIEEQKRNHPSGAPTKTIVRPLVKGGFKKQRGRLAYPVRGKPEYSFGSRIPASGMRSQGVFFKTRGPQPVKTIYNGRVLFADHLKGYGLLLIVDHGDDHISLYGHNELIYKQVGDRVETNETIARSGVSGGLKTAGLYFEIRQATIPVDPAAWCHQI